MPHSIPVIDVAPALGGTARQRLRIGQEIDRACRDTGFLTIIGHNVPRPTTDHLRVLAHRFFSQPLETKLQAVHPVAGTPRGFIAMGLEALSQANQTATPPDLKEFYHFGRAAWPDQPYFNGPEGARYFLPNLWPAWPEGFGAAADAYYQAVETLVTDLMRLSALGLGIDEHFFDDKIDRHISAMRLNWYPAQPAPPLPGQLRAGTHTDYGLLTILNGENVPGGLQLRTRGGAWLDVETDPAAFVVNIGDLMMRWTNDRWLSNQHRVVNPPAGSNLPRLSMAFFLHPNYDAMIEAIAPPGEAKYPPVQSGAFRDWKYSQARVAA